MLKFFLLLTLISASVCEDLHSGDYSDNPENDSEDLEVADTGQKNYKYYTWELRHTMNWLSKDHFDYKEILKSKHRSFEEVKFKRPLPFYGHPITNCLITSGGFIHMDEFRHRYLSHSMYVAPLMADFHTSDDYQPVSKILYYNSENFFVVWWENVRLNHEKKTPYTFQVIFYINGTIVFNYLSKMSKEMLKHVRESEEYHNLNVGISDASYYLKKLNSRVRAHVMQPYHKINLPVEHLENISSIVFNPLPTCAENTDCYSCIEARTKHDLDCVWCKTASKCSDGLDRFTQNWFDSECLEPTYLAATKEACSLPFNPLIVNKLRKKQKPIMNMADIIKNFQTNKMENSTQTPHRLIGYKTLFTKFLWFILLVIVFGTCFVAVKNARDPNTFIGRWFIQNRAFNRFRRRGDLLSAGEGSALGRIHINSSPNYVAFHNDDEPTEQPRPMNRDQNPPAYQLFQVVNQSAQEEQPSVPIAPHMLNVIPLDDNISPPSQTLPPSSKERSENSAQPAVR